MTDLQTLPEVADYLDCRRDACRECSDWQNGTCPSQDAALAARSRQAEELAVQFGHLRRALMQTQYGRQFLLDNDRCEQSYVDALDVERQAREAAEAELALLKAARFEVFEAPDGENGIRMVNWQDRAEKAEVARLRAMLDDAARFVNPHRLRSDFQSDDKTTAEVLAELERRQTRNEIPTTDTEENTMSRQGGG